LASRGNGDADVLLLNGEEVEPAKPFKPQSIEEQREDAEGRYEWMRIAFATDRFNVTDGDSPSVAEKFVPDDVDEESLLDLTIGSES
jgi:hypothetical protein